MSIAATQSAQLLDLSKTLSTIPPTLSMIAYAFWNTPLGLDAYILELQENTTGLSTSISELQEQHRSRPKVDLGEEIEIMTELVDELKEDVAELIRSGGQVVTQKDVGDGVFDMDMMRKEVEMLKVSVQGLKKGGVKGCDGHQNGHLPEK